MKNEYFGYVRVSTQKQGEGASLEAQKDAITRYAAHNKLTITNWYCEKETAAKTGRPVFADMVKALKKQKAAGFIVHKIDRSARNFKDWAMIGDLSDAGFAVHFATETLDFRSRGGRLAADIQAVIAADYIRNLREETIKGLTGRLKQGLYPFKAPLGYLDNGGGKVKTVCPVKGPLVRELFELYATGSHTIQSLQQHAYEANLKNQRGGALSVGYLGWMLSNPFYCGIIKIKRTGETYSGIHKPIIPVSLWKRVQAVKAGVTVKRITKHKHRYRGLFVCDHCRYTMVGERQKGLVYYRCHTRSCPTNTIRQENIDADIREVLSDVGLDNKTCAALRFAANSWSTAPAISRNELSLTRQLKVLEGKQETLTEAFLSKVIDAETYTEQKERMALERRRIEDQVNQGNTCSKTVETLATFLELTKSLVLLYDFMTDDEKREFLQIASSNRTIKDKKAYFKPRNWLLMMKSDGVVASGTHKPPNPRSGHIPDVEAVMEAMATPEAERCISLCQLAQDRAIMENHSECGE